MSPANDKKAKYLIINANDICKQLYRTKREFAFNDFYNIFYPGRTSNANGVFEKYNIPKEFQKIIIKINQPLFTKVQVEEYTMGFVFDLATRIIENENNQEYIIASSNPKFDDRQILKDKIKFKTEFHYITFEDAISFLEEIYDTGYFKSYIQSIQDFFGTKVNLEYTIDTWKKIQNKHKVLKLHK